MSGSSPSSEEARILASSPGSPDPHANAGAAQEMMAKTVANIRRLQENVNNASSSSSSSGALPPPASGVSTVWVGNYQVINFKGKK